MMEKETVVLRSTILPIVMRRSLWMGTLLGGGGVLCLFLGGAFIPLPIMKTWGPWLFLFSLTLITWGLLPYKRLKRLEEKPDTLTIEGLRWIHFSVRGKSLFSIPIDSIEHVNYVDQGRSYGIAITLKQPLPKKLVIQDPSCDLESVFKLKRSLNLHGCDLFFPYFSRRSYESMQEYLY